MDIPDELINLEQAAETERARMAGLAGEEYDAQWAKWLEAAEKVQAKITEHAKASGDNRMAVEMAVKKAVRHTEQDPAE